MSRRKTFDVGVVAKCAPLNTRPDVSSTKPLQITPLVSEQSSYTAVAAVAAYANPLHETTQPQVGRRVTVAA